jgi:hypothetical protein
MPSPTNTDTLGKPAQNAVQMTARTVGTVGSMSKRKVIAESCVATVAIPSVGSVLVEGSARSMTFTGTVESMITNHAERLPEYFSNLD